MSGHNCQFIIDFHMEPGEDGDPIFCDAPAGIKYDGAWFCPEHYDLVVDDKASQTYETGNGLVIGLDLSMEKDATFSFAYGKD